MAEKDIASVHTDHTEYVENSGIQQGEKWWNLKVLANRE